MTVRCVAIAPRRTPAKKPGVSIVMPQCASSSTALAGTMPDLPQPELHAQDALDDAKLDPRRAAEEAVRDALAARRLGHRGRQRG